MSSRYFSSIPAQPLRGSTLWASVFGVPPPIPQDPPMVHYRPMSLAQPFDLLERIKNKTPIIGAVCGIPSPDIARLMAGVGYDFLLIDWEHTPLGIREITEIIKMINLASEGHTAVIVRVPGFHHEYIAWALDAGASGVIVPHTETAEQARKVVEAARFLKANHGARSYPPFALFPGINDATPGSTLPLHVWNQAAVILQIESKVGCDNAEEIAAVPGVTGLMIGFGDLTFDLGLPVEAMAGHPVRDAYVEKVLAASRKHDLPVLAWCNSETVGAKLAEGYRIVTVDSDVVALAKELRRNLLAVRGLVKDAKASEKAEGQ